MGGTEKLNRFMTERVSSRVLYLLTITNTQEGRAAQTVRSRTNYDTIESSVCAMRETHTLFYEEDTEVLLIQDKKRTVQ